MFDDIAVLKKRKKRKNRKKGKEGKKRKQIMKIETVVMKKITKRDEHNREEEQLDQRPDNNESKKNKQKHNQPLARKGNHRTSNVSLVIASTESTGTTFAGTAVVARGSRYRRSPNNTKDERKAIFESKKA